ncbi:VOC family protein [uncultured Sunxiuqinia sp.]|uniref:VOC family protein n=1 Tax=uncultured Sunxiuqinia sp. TaxID=1573825 RepID=UPI002AA8F073|nr:VOC family protein [uncultured Sunxiuqinia sp.]
MKPRLNIVTIGVTNLKKSCEFYRKALGWETAKGSYDQIAFYNQSGIIFALYPLDKLAKDAEIPADRSRFSGVTLAINLESIEAVDQLYKQVIENGGKSLVEPRKTFWGGYDCYFADPDGHSWEIAWAPFWKFDDNGNLIL